MEDNRLGVVVGLFSDELFASGPDVITRFEESSARHQ